MYWTMVHIKWVRVSIFVLVSCFPCMLCKTVFGVLSTLEAQLQRGQYLATFCFHGETAEAKYKLNTSGHANPRLYFFLDEDWAEARNTEKCIHKLEMARLVHDIQAEDGNHTLAHFAWPRIWHIVYADSYTCDLARPISPLEKPNYINFEMKLFNPDSLNNPTDHFSDEESGLFRFYQLLTVTYFVLFCIYSPRLYEALQKQGPMHLVIQLLSVAMALQAIGSFLMMMHLRGYSKDGLGSPLFELMSEFFDVLSQFVMLYMLLSLSMGWTLMGTFKPAHSLAKLKDKPAAKFIGCIGVLQAILFLWEQYEEREHRMYHAHRSFAGVALVLMRILVAAILASNLYSTVSVERSKLKRDFYKTFAKCCTLWFLSYPVLVVTSWMFAPYLRYKLVTMSVVFSQSTAVIMLYRLFLSRSLYWEVSALSSSLPLRMDKTFGMKMYS